MTDLDLAALVATMPFAVHSGVEITASSRDAVVGHLDWSEERCTTGGLMHGGALMTLADSAGAVCAFLNLPAGAGTSTIDSSVSFLRGVRSGTARAVSRPLRAGRSVIVVRTEITDDDGRLAVHVVQSQAVVQPRGTDDQKGR